MSCCHQLANLSKSYFPHSQFSCVMVKYRAGRVMHAIHITRCNFSQCRCPYARSRLKPVLHVLRFVADLLYKEFTIRLVWSWTTCCPTSPQHMVVEFGLPFWLTFRDVDVIVSDTIVSHAGNDLTKLNCGPRCACSTETTHAIVCRWRISNTLYETAWCGVTRPPSYWHNQLLTEISKSLSPTYSINSVQ